MEMEMGMGMGGGDGSVQRAACAGTGVGPVGLAPGLLGTVRVHVYYGSDSEEIC